MHVCVYVPVCECECVYVMVITLLLPAGPTLRVPSFKPTLWCPLSSKLMAAAEQDGVPAAVTASLPPSHFPAPLHLLPEFELQTPWAGACGGG